MMASTADSLALFGLDDAVGDAARSAGLSPPQKKVPTFADEDGGENEVATVAVAKDDLDRARREAAAFQEPSPRPVPMLGEPEEESTRAVPREELLRGQDASFIVGDDPGSGEDATLAVGPAANEAATHKDLAALAATVIGDAAIPPPLPPPIPHAQGPASYPFESGIQAPQSWNQPGPGPLPGPNPMSGPGPMPGPSMNAFGGLQPGSNPQMQAMPPSSPHAPGSNPQVAHMPGSNPHMPTSNPHMPNGHAPGSNAHAPGSNPHMPASNPHFPIPANQMAAAQNMPQSGQMPISQPMGPMGPANPIPYPGHMPAPYGAAPKRKFKLSGQIILLIVVGAICLGIFIIGVVLFATTKF